jgi:peptide/nickel transport system substrate-binding protein
LLLIGETFCAMRKRVVVWGVLALLLVGTWACRPRKVVVEKPVTQIVPQTETVEKTTVVTNTVEKPVIVTELKTVQVVVTLTPTPIPEGGFVVRTTFADAKTANPLFAADRGSRALCALMFEGLLTVNPFTGALEPNFAKGWTVSEDDLTYTFSIRRGLSWSDGVPVTAHDFYFTYAALLSGKLDTPHATLASGIQEIKALDDYTVAVTFTQPDCANLERLQLGWIPAHVFTSLPGADTSTDVDTYDFAELAGHEFNSVPTVFSGPFMLQEWVRGDHWTQVRNPRYWRGVPYLEGIVTHIASGQSEMVEMLKNGEVDIGVGIDPQYLVELEIDPGLQILKFLSDEYDFIGFQLGDPNNPQPRLNPDGTLNESHGEHPILKDNRIRQAIVHALDRTEIIARARVGQGIPLHANVLPTVSWAYNTDLRPREYDVEKASQLLTQAGWIMDEGTGIRVKNGRPLKLRLYTNSGNVIRETIGQRVQKQLAKVGIEVELITVEWNAFLDVLFGQTFDMVIVSWTNLGVNPDDRDLWRAQDDLPGKGNNFVSYYNPDIEESLAQAKTAPGCAQDLRTQLYRQIQAQLYQDQPYCWLDVPRNLVAVNERVGGINPGPWSVWHNVHEWYIRE